ncbi:MAG: hypothetical protein Q9160_004080 [Pyrenula sp. 1 TL-2023]
MSSTHETSFGTKADSLPAPSFVKPSQPASATSKPSKRLTLNFPILPPSNFDARSVTSSPSLLTPAESQHSSPRLKLTVPSPGESSEFLTSLAAQERKVLELREELHRAEAELLALKKRWAQYEAHKKKHEVRHGERMEAISLAGGRVESGQTNPKKALEGERPRDVKVGGKRTQQRVFSGSKHARALSLLSPTSENQLSSRSHSISGVPNLNAHPKEEESRSTVDDQGTMQENGTPTKHEKELLARRSLPAPSRDTLVRTSKQVASELREGLWTFFEDIRQATVGEEGINGTESRGAVVSSKKAPGTTSTLKAKTPACPPSDQGQRPKQKSTTASQNPSAKDGESSFWEEFGLDTPKRIAPNIKSSAGPEQKIDTPSLVDVDDNWDYWDTPLSQNRLSNATTETSERDLSALQEKVAMTSNALPWPELKKFTPSKLTRTVSDLMKEWDSPSNGNLRTGKKERDDDDEIKSALR